MNLPRGGIESVRRNARLLPGAGTLARRALYLARYATYVPTELYVSHCSRLIYVSMPKAACTSIQGALAENAGLEVRRRPRRSERDYVTFTFVRDPFERLVSCYRDKILRFQDDVGRYHFETRYNLVVVRRLSGGTFRSEMSFAEFVELVAKVPDRLADTHIKSQWGIIRDSGYRELDFVGHFEHLDRDWAQLARRHRLAELPHANAGGSAVSLLEYYTNRSVLNQVADRYACDVEKWEYERTYDELALHLEGKS